MHRSGLGAVILFATASAVPALAQGTGSCTATTHRTLQNAVDSQCGAAKACLISDTQATLSSKIGQHSKCIDARKAINNTCFGGGDAGHKQAITERTNAITNCQTYQKTAKP
jgi:Novel toxin 16